jgi:hypothetical protein
MLEILMNALADRSILLLTLILNFGLFAYALYQPTELRIAIAAIFSVTVFIPILRMERKSHGEQSRREQGQADREVG